MAPLARVVHDPGGDADVTAGNGPIGVEANPGTRYQRVPLAARSRQDAMRQVVLESGAIRLERREIRRVEVEHVLIRDDHPDVAERLVGVHGALDALRQGDWLQAGT